MKTKKIRLYVCALLNKNLIYLKEQKEPKYDIYDFMSFSFINHLLKTNNYLSHLKINQLNLKKNPQFQKITKQQKNQNSFFKKFQKLIQSNFQLNYFKFNFQELISFFSFNTIQIEFNNQKANILIRLQKESNMDMQLLNYTQTQMGKYGPIQWMKTDSSDEFQRSYFNSTNYSLNARIIQELKQIKANLGTVRKGKIISRLILAYLFFIVLASALFVYVVSQDPKSDLSKIVQIVYMTCVIVFTFGLMIFVLWYSSRVCKQIEASINQLNKKYADQNLKIVLVPQKEMEGNYIKNYRFIELFEKVYH